MVQINIEKKHLFIIIIFLSLCTLALVIAGNPSTKPNPGHASNEVMVNISGVDKTLQDAIDDGSLGSGGLSCPIGFTKVESQGRILGCMQNSEEGTAIWEVATNNCFTKYGGRLPSASEWTISASQYTLNDETDDWEFMDDWTATNDRGCIGNGGINQMQYCGGSSRAYRCFIPA